ncbi:MAG TPA: hypothetical protein VN734_11545 [Acidobacteriaceae bacterium]|nr:hypothetical protein [Acidobacteriaceae bacterium]
MFSVTLLLAVLSAQTAAPHRSEPTAWPLTHLHETSTLLERFPPAERSIALSLLKPDLGPLVQGESSQQLNGLMRSFRAERLTLAGNQALAVQPSGNELCGATGNCSFWIVDLRHRHVVLNAVGIQSFAVSAARPGGMPDIITSSHASAYEQERIRWQFQGSSYERESCATVNTANDDGQPYPTPRITAHPCSTEGN